MGKMVKEESSQPLSPTSLLREALRSPFRSKKRMVSITLLRLLPLTLLDIFHDLAVGPLLLELEYLSESELNLSKTAKIKKYLMVFLVADSLFFFAFSLLFSFAMTETTYSSAVLYTGNNNYSVSLKEWFLRIIKIWKRPLITWLDIALITNTYGFLVLVLFVFFPLISTGFAFDVWIVVVGFLASLFYLYLINVWIRGLLVFVLEDGFYGRKALGRAKELIQGKKVDGFVLLMVVLVLLSAPVSVIFYLDTVDDDLGAVAHFVIATFMTVLICLVKLFAFVVYTVFYFECKNRHGDEVEMEMATGYSLISNVLGSSDSLP